MAKMPRAGATIGSIKDFRGEWLEGEGGVDRAAIRNAEEEKRRRICLDGMLCEGRVRYKPVSSAVSNQCETNEQTRQGDAT